MLTSYERYCLALNHSPSSACDIIAEGAVQARLEEHFGVKSWWDVQDILGGDKRLVTPRYIGPELKTFPDGSCETIVSGGPRVRTIDTPMGPIGAYTYFPWEDVTDPSQLEGRWGWNGKMEWWDFSNVTREIDALEERGKYWIAALGDPSGLQHLCMWVGDENFLCTLAADEELAVAMIEKHNEIRLEHALRTLEAGGGRIHELDGGGDYGTQRALLIRPEMFRRYFKPLYKAFYKEIKDNYDVKIQFHSCGSIADIIPDLIEVGVDILDPIQPAAAGMEPMGLKKAYGDSLVFHGGMDIQELLPHGSPEDVRREVRRLYSILGKDGGYILAPSHNIQVDTSLENILAMYDEVALIRREMEAD